MTFWQATPNDASCPCQECQVAPKWIMMERYSWTRFTGRMLCNGCYQAEKQERYAQQVAMARKYDADGYAYDGED